MATHYLDWNAAALVTPEAIKAMVRWANAGDPSAFHARAKEARRMLDAFREEIATECAFDLADFEVIFTSGASEANATILAGAVRAYAAKTGVLPHVIVGAAEHVSLLEGARRLAKEGHCQLTVLPVGTYGARLGAVSAAALESALRPNTCLVTVAAACPVTGTLNNLRRLAAAAHAAKAPFHSDAAQLFGRSAVRPAALGLDAFSVSFRKLGAPPGVGALVIRRSLIRGYGMAPLISGPQNAAMRGGAENVPGLGAAFEAYRTAMSRRAEKTARVRRLRDAAWAGLGARLPCFSFDAHPGDPPPSIDGGITPPPPPRAGEEPALRAIAAADDSDEPAVFWVAPPDPRLVLPNTLLLAVRRPGFSAPAARAALEARGVIVGAPAPSDGAVAALGLPAALRGCLLRASFGDGSAADDVRAFVEAFVAVVTSGECLG